MRLFSLSGALSLTTPRSALAALSPLHAVAALLDPAARAAGGAHNPSRAALPAFGAVRSLHATPASFGGRYTTQVPEKQARWRTNMSKKAKKRIKRQGETATRRSSAMPQLVVPRMKMTSSSTRERGGGGGGTAGALSLAPSSSPAPATTTAAALEARALARLPPPEELEARSAANRAVIESALLMEPTPERAGDELARADAEAFAAQHGIHVPGMGPSRGSGAGGVPNPLTTAPPPPPPPPHVWNQYMRILGAQGRVVEAVAAYAEMRRRASESAAAAAAAAAADGGGGWVGDGAQGFEGDVYTLSALLTAASHGRNLPVAEQVWESLTGRPAPGRMPEPTAAQVAAGEAAEGRGPAPRRRGTPDDPPRRGEAAAPSPSSTLPPHGSARPSPAAPSAASASGGGGPFIVPNAACYGALIQAHVRAFDLPGAFRVLSAAEAAGADLSSPILWTHLVVACVRSGEYERAVDTFEHMRTFHAMPDAVAYTALITACGRTDQVERVLDLLSEMKQMGVRATGVTYNAAIHACGRSLRRHTHAHELFWEMDALGLERDVRTYHGVLLACSHTGDVKMAREYVAHALGGAGGGTGARGLSNPIRLDTVALNTLLTVYARAIAHAARKPQSGRKALGKALTVEGLASTKSDGGDLPFLEAEGLLSADATLVKRAEVALGVGKDKASRAVDRGAAVIRAHSSARRVLGDPGDLADALLADYFGTAGEDHPANQDPDVAALESGEGPDSAAFDPVTGPGSARDVLNPSDPQWVRLKGQLLETGMVPPGLLDDLEEEYSQPPPASEAEEAERAAVYEARHRQRMMEFAEDALDMAQKEEADVKDMNADIVDGAREGGRGGRQVQRRRRGGSGGGVGGTPASSSGPGPFVPRFEDEGSASDSDGEEIDVVAAAASGPDDATVGLGGVFSDVMAHAEKVAGAGAGKAGALSAPSAPVSTTAGDSLAALPQKPAALPSVSTSSSLVLEAARTGARVPMREYMGAMEREVMEGAFGPQWAYELADDEEDALAVARDRAAQDAEAVRRAAETRAEVAALLGQPRDEVATVVGGSGGEGGAAAPDALAVVPGAPASSSSSSSSPSDDAVSSLSAASSIPSVAEVPRAPSFGSPAVVRGPDGKAYVLRRRWVSMFGAGDAHDHQPQSEQTLGGVRLSDLFDVNTVPLPPGLLKKLERGARKGELDFEDVEAIDVGSLYEHTEAVMRARVQAALMREAFGVSGRETAKGKEAARRARRLAEAMSLPSTVYDDPTLSDGVVEYAAAAGVKLPQRLVKQRAAEAAARAAAAEEAGEGALVVPAAGQEWDAAAASANDRADKAAVGGRTSLQRAAARALRGLGGSAGKKEAEGSFASSSDSPNAAGSPLQPPPGAAGGALPRPGEEIVLSTLSLEDDKAYSMAPTGGPEDSVERATLADPDGLSPLQRSHRSFTARVLSRVLARHPIGPVERKLIAAGEKADKRRQREMRAAAAAADDGAEPAYEPGLLDALFAVQRIKQQVMDARASGARAGGSGAGVLAITASSSPAGDGARTSRARAAAAPGLAQEAEKTESEARNERQEVEGEEDALDAVEAASEALRASPLVAKMVQERQEARQAAARADLAAAAAADPAAAARLTALAVLSEKTLGPGAVWLPSGPLPADRAERRAALLDEVRRIYPAEYEANGLAPDAVTLNVVLSALADAGKSDAAYAFLEREFPMAGVQPDVRTFRALIRMHVAARQHDRAAELLDAMADVGVAADGDCIGLVVHARAREWRVRDSIALVQRAKGSGVKVPEQHARLLRQRCKSLGIFHPDVPEHPVGWQFTPENMKRRFAGAKSKAIRKEWTQGLRPKLRDGMR